MITIARKFAAAAAAFLLCLPASFAQVAAGSDADLAAQAAAQAAAVRGRTALLRKAALAVNGAPAGGAECREDSELDFSRFVLAFRAAGQDGVVKSEFSYSTCRRFSRNDYQAPYAVRSYKGAGFDLLIVTEQDAQDSELVLTTSAGAFAGKLGKVDTQKLLGPGAVDLGPVSFGDDASARRTGTAAVKRIPSHVQAAPTNHLCDPLDCGA